MGNCVYCPPKAARTAVYRVAGSIGPKQAVRHVCEKCLTGVVQLLRPRAPWQRRLIVTLLEGALAN